MKTGINKQSSDDEIKGFRPLKHSHIQFTDIFVKDNLKVSKFIGNRNEKHL